jgi:probable HAF family extracellular repeat protein
MRDRLNFKPPLHTVSARAGLVRAIILGLCIGVGVILSQNAPAEGSSYAIVEIQGAVIPRRLNNFGDVAGKAFDPASGEGQATTWSHGRRRLLGKFVGGDYSAASAINDTGQVVGDGNTSNSVVPFLWMSARGLRRIALLPGDNCGQAIAINRYGHVVGYSSGPDGKKAFLWRRGNDIRGLGILSGGNYSTASDVNDSDDAVGTSGSVNGDRAVLWTSTGDMIDLGTLPGDIESEASAISNNGTVIGYSKGPQATRAFVWTEASGMQELGTLPGQISSRALAINNADTVVGSSTTSSGDRAFIWTRQSGIRDLNSQASPGSGVVLVEAHAINNRGQILALGINTHDMANEPSICAPAPQSSILLTPQ